VTPEERAKAIVEHFATMLPPAVGPQLENVIARAITRAVNQELATRHKADRRSDCPRPLTGRTVKIHDSALHGGGNAYPLPDGLTDGQPVTVVAFDHGYATVKDETGKEWQVFLTNIDSG
jgi:hypothetical protein